MPNFKDHGFEEENSANETITSYCQTEPIKKLGWKDRCC
jgi:hypothetical protein